MKMTKAQKRVEIAKDVLKQIKANKYKPTFGVWFRDSKGKYLEDFFLWETKTPLDAKKDVVDKLTGTCDVCALGSLFISAVDKYNHTVLDPKFGYTDVDFFTDTGKINPLLKWFTKQQLLLIESTFEVENGAWYPEMVNPKAGTHWDEKISPAIRKFAMKYSNSTDRLKAIMNNIVRNKGTFVLPGVKP